MEKINMPEENIFDMIKRLDLGEKSILEVVTEIDKLRHDKVSLLADVRRLVEAAGKSVWFEKQHLKATCPGCLEYPNDTCSHGEEFSPIVQLLTQAIAAVERHLEKVA